MEISLRCTAASRSLDNITVLILGLKNLKTTIKKLNEGMTLPQVRQQIQSEQKLIQNTYDVDFMEVEVIESDLNLLSEPNTVVSQHDMLILSGENSTPKRSKLLNSIQKS